MAPEIRLSPEQQKVVDHRHGHLQVIACAGSGKTESVSRRNAELIAEGALPESNPSSPPPSPSAPPPS